MPYNSVIWMLPNSVLVLQLLRVEKVKSTLKYSARAVGRTG